jgi:hypothetical protein
MVKNLVHTDCDGKKHTTIFIQQLTNKKRNYKLKNNW